MLELLVLIAAIALAIAFFRVEGGRGLAIQFPTTASQKGFRTRTNGYIVLVIMAGAIAFAYLHSRTRSAGGLILIMLSAMVVVFLSSKKSKK